MVFIAIAIGREANLIKDICESAESVYQMSVDAHVSRGSSEALVFPVWNVLVCINVDVELGQAEVDNVNHLVTPQRSPTDQKIFWFDVAVNEVLGMYVFHEVEGLNSYEQHRLKRKLTATGVKQVLQARPEQLHDKCVILSANAEVVDFRHALVSAQLFVESKI